MIRRTFGVVEKIYEERPGLQEILVRCSAEQTGVNSAVSPSVDLQRPAVNLTELTGHVVVGDRVELNTVAVELNLGTGGQDFVVTVLDRLPEPFTPPGHIIKMRYTPHQTAVLAIEAPESPFHQAIAGFTSLDETPVVCFELHSQLPVICSALSWALAQHGLKARVVYIMTDGAALSLPLSRWLPRLKSLGLLTSTISAGQAFGGDYEAINLYSAMAAAKEALNADVIVVGQGPGNVGTGTRLGFSGVDQGLAVNAAASLEGAPIFVPRISFGDSRTRHIGLSHHTITNLKTVIRASALLPIPRLSKHDLQKLFSVLEDCGIMDLHDVITVDADKGLKAFEDTGLKVTTMGRDLSVERPFFLAAAAAGLLAAQLAEIRMQHSHARK